MKLNLWLICACMMPYVQSRTPLESVYNFGDARWCIDRARKTNFSLARLSVLPGFGWDNLRNLIAGKVASFNFTKCQTTADGKLLIPDNVFTVPIKESEVNLYAHTIESWQEHSSVDSKTININMDAAYWGLAFSGSFSYDAQKIKKEHLKHNSVTMRVQLKYKRYSVKLQPDFQLNDQFRSRVINIANFITKNNTNQAIYEAQLLVRDYGTHYLTTAEAGAQIVKDDSLRRSVLSKSSTAKSDMAIEASISFMEIFEINGRYNHKKKEDVKSGYKDEITNSHVISYGGPKLGANPKLDDWLSKVDSNLVFTDKAGETLDFIIKTSMFPELSLPIVHKLEKLVREAVLQYYKANTIEGCTVYNSTKRDDSANVDDGSCNLTYTLQKFGGFYFERNITERWGPQDNYKIHEKNTEVTGEKCGPGFKPEILTQERDSWKNAKEILWRNDCGQLKKAWIFHYVVQYPIHYYDTFKQYNNNKKKPCTVLNLTKEEINTTYWCAAYQETFSKGFGGFWSPMSTNPATQRKDCPAGFKEQKVYENLVACIKKNTDGYTLPVGGFFSDDYGNTLANNSKRCPSGFSKHLAYTTKYANNIYYCIIKGRLLKQGLIPSIVRPPFVEKASYFGTSGKFDIINQGLLKEEDTRHYKKVMANRFNKPNSSLSSVAVAGIAIVATLVILAVGTGIGVMIRRKYWKNRNAEEEPEPLGEIYESSGNPPDSTSV